MSSDDTPEVATVSSKGQITIPSRLREQFGITQGTKLLVIPTEHGLMSKTLDLPSVEEFQERVADRSDDTSLSLSDVTSLLEETRDD